MPARRWRTVDFYGVDVQRRCSVFACVEGQGRAARGRRVANTSAEPVGVVAPSGGQVKVVLGATGHWGCVNDALAPHVAEVVPAHPLRAKATATARVKTDAVEAGTLARLLRADLIPAAYAAPWDVRDRRDWLRARCQTVPSQRPAWMADR